MPSQGSIHNGLLGKMSKLKKMKPIKQNTTYRKRFTISNIAGKNGQTDHLIPVCIDQC